ncbi:hypothetical protein PENTCL1PPCAC_21504, partial [Pristionchus entomophagus]
MKLALLLVSLLVKVNSQDSSATTTTSTCPSGYEPLSGSGCFSFLDSDNVPHTFTSAQDACEAIEGSLVTILSAEENNLIMGEANNKYGKSGSFWLGLTCTNG